jgi:hypothetical protein
MRNAGLQDDRAMIMHPTAEGLAGTADANLEEIKKLEKPDYQHAFLLPPRSW